MQHLIELRSEGERGPVYLRFRFATVADSGPSDEDDDVVIDCAGDGSVVGVELVSIVPETVLALAAVASRLHLDLSPLFTRPLPNQAA